MAMERMRASLMQNQSLYQEAVLKPAKFGKIHGIEVGHTWDSRQACAASGVHTKNFAGISGNANTGAYSVVLSGAYEDDDDQGETFIYTGTGGRAETGSFGGQSPQVEDQSFEHHDNAALLKSAENGRPVRVVRAYWDNRVSRTRYRYDGLYRVEQAFMAKGKSGHWVCRYNFRRIVDGQPPLPRQV